MSDHHGGESERLAPVTPLFGRRRGASESDDAGDRIPRLDEHGSRSHTSRSHTTGDGVSDEARRAAEVVVPRRTGDAGLWRSTWNGDDLSGSMAEEASGGSPSEGHPARGAAGRGPRLRPLNAVPDSSGGAFGEAGTGARSPQSDEEIRAAAEELLVRKLRSRSLSVSEARLVLRGYENDGRRLDAHQVDDVVAEFERRGYLDDAVLAEQLVTGGVQRKGQGRVALTRALAQRGIPREVIDAALEELPDDDAERALEFARAKATSLARLDPDTALRRLVGQLARRGYNGGVAMSAAKTALAEASGRGASGVRFVDSD
jgi:regulatory protein